MTQLAKQLGSILAILVLILIGVTVSAEQENRKFDQLLKKEMLAQQQVPMMPEPDMPDIRDEIPADRFFNESVGKFFSQNINRMNSYVALLDGSKEVPGNMSDAKGAFMMTVSNDRQSIDFVLDVQNLSDVNEAHIHLGQPGQNGPPVVWLFPDSNGPETIDGITNGQLAKGKITADDMVGPLAGKTIEALVTEIENGNIFVNVHTEQHPSGEIRGQLMHLNLSARNTKVT